MSKCSQRSPSSAVRDLWGGLWRFHRVSRFIALHVQCYQLIFADQTLCYCESLRILARFIAVLPFVCREKAFCYDMTSRPTHNSQAVASDAMISPDESNPSSSAANSSNVCLVQAQRTHLQRPNHLCRTSLLLPFWLPL